MENNLWVKWYPRISTIIENMFIATDVMNSALWNLFCRLTAFFLFSGLKSAFLDQKIYFPHSTFHIPHSTFHIPHSTFHIPHSTFHIPHSTFHIPQTQQPKKLTNYPKNSFSFYTYINHSVRANFYVT
jgi:hypothetical protein